MEPGGSEVRALTQSDSGEGLPPGLPSCAPINQRGGQTEEKLLLLLLLLLVVVILKIKSRPFAVNYVVCQFVCALVYF